MTRIEIMTSVLAGSVRSTEPVDSLVHRAGSIADRVLATELIDEPMRKMLAGTLQPQDPDQSTVAVITAAIGFDTFPRASMHDLCVVFGRFAVTQVARTMLGRSVAASTMLGTDQG